MTAAIAVGLLVAAGVYLLLQRGLVRIAIGFVLLGHAANILLVAAGGMALRGEPLLGTDDPAQMADPLPQAFVLTAIVITFGITVFMLALARAGGDDDPAGPGGEPIDDTGAGAGPAGDPADDPAGNPGGDRHENPEAGPGSGRSSAAAPGRENAADRGHGSGGAEAS
jgi:multicomponent Na+:H+ antiporter subunit C